MDQNGKRYYNSLNDNKWTKRRFEILKRDLYKCSVCGSSENLCVHHKYYYSGPFTHAWKYPDDCLITMCEDCHNKHHKNNSVVFKSKPTIKDKQNKKKAKKGLINRLMKEAIKAEKKINAKYR